MYMYTNMVKCTVLRILITNCTKIVSPTSVCMTDITLKNLNFFLHGIRNVAKRSIVTASWRYMLKHTL